MKTELEHTTVLLNEAIHGLDIDPEGIYIDGTFGRGGHSQHILNALGSQGRLIAFDRDPAAIAAATKFAHDARFHIVHSDFTRLIEQVEHLNLSGQISGILLDLGVSSPQLDDPDRGFSFRQDGPLDMRMNNTQGTTASEWLNSADVEDIAWVLKHYGEERFAKKIARAVVHDRVTQPFVTTKQLADLIVRLVPKQEKHPATRSFQAIRIYINQELQQIEQVLEDSLHVLKPHGRLAVISFHSLEDRIVKHFILKHSRPPELPRGLPIRDDQMSFEKQLEPIGKPIKPTTEEIACNPRARSSVLRVAKRLETKRHA